MGSDHGAPVAAIDCGTNSTRLLVVDGSGRTLVRVMRITRLGQGVDASHHLSPVAVERTLGVLREFRGTMDGFGVAQGRLVATSAVRDADNGDDFLRAAAVVTGLTAQLLSGDEEGRMAYRGATMGLPPAPADDVVVDIGGGSTEFVHARAGQVAAVSLDLGCVRLTERYLKSDLPTPEELRAAGAAIDTELERAETVLPALAHLPSGSRLLGLAGTVSTLALLELGLSGYDREVVHHSVISRSAASRWLAALAGEPASLRGLRPGVEAGREDVIVGGVLILSKVMSRLDFDECLVSESDILDGLAAGLRDPLGPASGEGP